MINSKFPYEKIKKYNNDILKFNYELANIFCTSAITASEKKYTSIYSGLGADELFSDYGFNKTRFSGYKSVFGGEFPQDLETIFPYYSNKWYSLYHDLRMNDYANGLFGIDSRTPYLDKTLFQTWLRSNSSIKNSNYKNWIKIYMELCDYPFAKEKIGITSLKINIE